MPGSPTIVWFRRDLRLTDQPAFQAAVERGGPIVPVFIWAPQEEGTWSPGAASRWWLHASLSRLQSRLADGGLDLVVRVGESLGVLRDLVQETGAGAVYWNRLYEPSSLERDKNIKSNLRQAGCEARSYSASLLYEPWTVLTQQQCPYQVFTPFYRACQATVEPSTPEPAPSSPWPALPRPLASVELEALRLRPRIPWDATMRQTWEPGEAGATALLRTFARGALENYRIARDQPDSGGTSRLSPHLHFGEISPRQVWWTIRRSGAGAAAEPYLRQLLWREFAHHLLYHFPHTPDRPLRSAFDDFPWATDRQALGAWQRGCTGYPMVDAGMRELWATGWMHNRVRMIVASFLVKDLLIPWREGAAWFWDTLVDADLANNTLGWQWTAGCGADAAPFFRIFNPVLQGEKFDPDGAYVRRWVPELSALPARWIHRPFEAAKDALKAAGVRLGDTYPRPIVDHTQARTRALQAYDLLRRPVTARSEKD